MAYVHVSIHWFIRSHSLFALSFFFLAIHLLIYSITHSWFTNLLKDPSIYSWMHSSIEIAFTESLLTSACQAPTSSYTHSGSSSIPRKISRFCLDANKESIRREHDFKTHPLASVGTRSPTQFSSEQFLFCFQKCDPSPKWETRLRDQRKGSGWTTECLGSISREALVSHVSKSHLNKMRFARETAVPRVFPSQSGWRPLFASEQQLLRVPSSSTD